MRRAVCLRRLYAGRNKELVFLRAAVVFMLIFLTAQFFRIHTCPTIQTSIHQRNVHSKPEFWLTDESQPTDPPFMNSLSSKHWDHRPGTRSKFITIGIPSVQRHNTRTVYLYETLESLVNKTSEIDKQRVRVIVFLTDFNKTYNVDTDRTIRRRFQRHVKDEFISVVTINPDIYPNLTSVKRTFNDSMERVRWRAKQNIDFAYMFWYSRQVSKYYLQLEDDVITASGYLSDIEDFINKQSEDWFLLEFSFLGFIGKLFKSADLAWMAGFLYRKFDVLPCDLLLGQLRVEKGQCEPIHTNVSLFQHIGKFSSLKDKFMPSIDATFKDIRNSSARDIPKGDNPPAKIKTNIEQYGDYRPEFAYDSNIQTFFWGTSQKKKDYFILNFGTPQNISRIISVTGDRHFGRDLLGFGELRYSQSNHTKCGQFHYLVDFVDGEVDTRAQGVHLPDNIMCLRISVKKTWKTWLVIWRIEIFTKHGPVIS